MAVRTISVAERRARLVRRHGLAPTERSPDPVHAASRMVCLHATDPATVYLSVWARVDGFRVDDLDRVLYEERSLVKHLAMRRTLFVFPREALDAAQAGASARVAEAERKRLTKEVEQAGLVPDGARWLAEASAAVEHALAPGREATSSELRDEIPLLQGGISYGEGKTWGGTVPIGPRVLTVLSASGTIVRASNDGAWYVSRPRWTSTRSWLGRDLEPRTPEEGTAELVARWLQAFGPGTVTDLKWWLGSTVRAVRQALVDIGAIEVDLEQGDPGYVLPDDLDPEAPVEPSAALLPALDPTTMGWKERSWYLGPHQGDLFDTMGNAGPTAWWDGRIVGGWRQHADGSVDLELLEDVGRAGRAAFEARAEELTGWFDGRRVLPRFPSPLSKRLVG